MKIEQKVLKNTLTIKPLTKNSKAITIPMETIIEVDIHEGIGSYQDFYFDIDPSEYHSFN